MITLKSEIEPTAGRPTDDLTPECQMFIKSTFDLDVKLVSEAIKEPTILTYIQKCIDDTNKEAISRAQNVRKWKLLDTDFSIDGGELTPTMKLKRKFTEKKFIELVDQMYMEAKL